MEEFLSIEAIKLIKTVFLLMLIVNPIYMYIARSDYFTVAQKYVLVLSTSLFFPGGIITGFILKKRNIKEQKKMLKKPDFFRDVLYNKLYIETRSESEAEEEIKMINSKIELLKESYDKGVISKVDYSLKKEMLNEVTRSLNSRVNYLREIREYVDNSSEQVEVLSKLKDEGLISQDKFVKEKKRILSNKESHKNDSKEKTFENAFYSIFMTIGYVFFSMIFVFFNLGLIWILGNLEYSEDKWFILIMTWMLIFSHSLLFLSLENEANRL